MKPDPQAELVDVIDEQGRTVGIVTRQEMRARRLPHRCVYVLVFNRQGELFLHLRTATKDVYPSHWDVTVGGVLAAGESFDIGARRELHEELGVEAVPQQLFPVRYADPATVAQAMAYRVVHDGPFRLQPEEVVRGEFVPLEEIAQRTMRDRFCPDGLAVLTEYLRRAQFSPERMGSHLIPLLSSDLEEAAPIPLPPLTEDEWLSATEPQLMLQRAPNPPSERKLRLFACGCARLLGPLLEDERSRNALAVAERYADGEATWDELSRAEAQAWAARGEVRRLERPCRGNPEAVGDAAMAVWSTTIGRQAIYAATAAAHYATAARGRSPEAGAAPAAILRDVLGNPYRPLPPRPAAIAPLAEEVYRLGEFNGPRIRILGEWLQENGFWEPGQHCLDPAIQHVKGCWVIDLLLGKT